MKAKTNPLITALVTTCLLLLLSISPVESLEPVFSTKAEYAILVDYNSDTVLFEKQSNIRMIPSSMSKLMTIYIAFKHLKDGRIKLDDQFHVSEKAWRMGGSRTFLDLKHKVTVEDLIKGIIVQSGNDASVALAEGIAGDELLFVQQMNFEAKRLGLANSTFENSTGWPSPEHRMSCIDLAKLSAAIIRDFPEYYHYFGEKSFTYNKITQDNRNTLVGNGGIDGLKTGSTDEGGYGVAVSAERNGRRLIAVVNGLKTKSERVVEAERLLNYGFNSFKPWMVFKAGQKIQELQVKDGAEPLLELFADSDIEVLLPVFAKQEDILISVQYDKELMAPIARGTKIATLLIKCYEQVLKEVDLFAPSDVKEAGWMQKLWRKVISYF